ncbi:NADPH-dependent FMN reductase [Pedobacter sp. PWIIR3]
MERQLSNILAINGSASKESSNSKLVTELMKLSNSIFQVTVFDDLGVLPHFDPALTEQLPAVVAGLLNQIASAEGVIICFPEYIFSIPARLKNLTEWCVATTVFLDKPVGLITASADGQHGHAQLRLIIKTLGGWISEDAALVVPGVKGKFNADGECTDPYLKIQLSNFIQGFRRLLSK